jgi:hypothetical protein
MTDGTRNPVKIAQGKLIAYLLFSYLIFKCNGAAVTQKQQKIEEISDKDSSDEINIGGDLINKLFDGGDDDDEDNGNAGTTNKKKEQGVDRLVDKILKMVSKKSVQRGLNHTALNDQTAENLKDPNMKCDLICVITYCRNQNLSNSDLLKCIHQETSDKSSMIKFDMSSIISYGLNLAAGCILILIAVCFKKRKNSRKNRNNRHKRSIAAGNHIVQQF